MITSDQLKNYLKMAGITIIVVLTIVGIFTIGRCSCANGNGNDSKIIMELDTLIIRDTIRIDRPFPKEIRIIDTLFVEARDIVRVKEKIFVPVPREQKYYQTNEYQAWISGYHPRPDSINLFTSTHKIITSTTVQQPKHKPKRWGIGIQVGYGITLQQSNLQLVPYVGVGVSYNVI